MSEPGQERCPPLADLWLAMDGDLPLAQKRSVLEHMHSCAHCREDAYQAAVLLQEVASAYADIDGLADQRRQEQFLNRLAADHRTTPRTSIGWLRPASLFATMPRVPVRSHAKAHVLLVTFTVMITLFVSSSTVSTDAAEAKKALDAGIAHEGGTRQGEGQRVRVRLTQAPNPDESSPQIESFQVEMDVPFAASAPLASPTTPQSKNQEALNAILRGYHFDLSRPLSVVRFHWWRNSLHSRRDEVHTGDGHIEVRTIRTNPSDGPIRNAVLTLRLDTHEPVRQSLDLEGIGRLDVEQIQLLTKMETAVVPVASSRSSAPDAATLQERDLDARLVLQELGVDVCDDVQVQVATAPNGIRIAGQVGSDEIRRQVVERAAPLSVEVRLRVARGANRLVPPEAEQSRAFVARLGELLPTSPARSTFADGLAGATRAILQRTRVLRELATRYPPTDVGLSPRARGMLQRLVEAHHDAFNEDFLALERLMATLRRDNDSEHTHTKRRSAAAKEAPANWRDRIGEAEAIATVLDHHVRDLIRKDSTREGFHDAYERVVSTFNDLWECINSKAMLFLES